MLERAQTSLTPSLVLQVEQLTWGPSSSLRDGDAPLIDSVGLQVSAGSWVALTGPSGVGKTTFLNLCAGLLKPLSGRVCLFGQDLSQLRDSELSRLRSADVGLMFQSYQLDCTKTTLENILLPAYFASCPWHETKSRAEKLAADLGLGPHLKKSASVLSGGQKQRVALARALLLSPRLLLADEPTGALDEETAGTVLTIFAELARKGVTLLCVTHDQAVLELSDRVLTFSPAGLKEVGVE